MAVIAVYSVKGGVGKTTLAVDYAYRCAAFGGQETLLWDLDLQGGAGFLLDNPPPVWSRALSVFYHEGKPSHMIEKTNYDRLSLLPGDISLRDMPLQLVRIGATHRLQKLTRFLSRDYKRIILDCPPMINEVSDQIIRAADVIILPLPPSPLSARALGHVRNELAKFDRHPPLLPVLSMYDARRQLHRSAREGFASSWPVVPISSWVEQSAARHAPLPTFSNWCDPSKALDRLWRGVERKLEELGKA